MQLVAAEILTEAHGMSWPVAAFGIIVGMFLWVFGWQWHRFWIVFVTTVIAGTVGLTMQQEIGPRMLAAGVLLAIAAGLLAMDLSRLIAFAVGGSVCWLTVHAIVPTFQQPLICFLIGGILGIFTYRLQWMLLSSLVGTLLTTYSIVLLIEKLSGPDFVAVDWTRMNALGLNIGVVVFSLLGIAVQGQLERRRESREQRKRDKALATLSEAEREHIKQLPRRSWLGTLFGKEREAVPNQPWRRSA